MTKKLDVIELLLDSHHGQYIPKHFAECCNPEINTNWHWDMKDAEALLLGPDQENYWDVWNDVEQNAYFIDPETGFKYYLRQNDDLFVIREGWSYNDAEELQNDETGEIFAP